jgi:hypothetical protein
MKGKIDQNVSMRLGISIYRRKHLINAVMGSGRAQETGRTVMGKFQTQVNSNPETKDKLLDPKSIHDDYLPSLPKKRVLL